MAAWQHRLDPVQRRVAGGCHLSRDIPALVSASGLEVEAVDAAYLPGPRLAPWGFGYLGTGASRGMTRGRVSGARRSSIELRR